MLKIGLKNNICEKVTEANIASSLASGTLPVYATPAMILLVERTCMELAAPYLEEGYTTVGTRIDIAHLSATPLSMEVHTECTLTEIDRRRLVFSCEVYDNKGIIGKGIHERFIVDSARFLTKAEEKLHS